MEERLFIRNSNFVILPLEDRLKAGLQRGGQFFDNWVVMEEKVPLRGFSIV
jgi:hypothetical protein